ncbi:MAG: SCO family protein [Alphaproteobacteria bacterium]
MVRRMLLAALLAMGPLASAALAHQNQSSVIDEANALSVSRAALGRPVGDYRFRDTSLSEVTLSDFRGRPLVVTMIYTSCTHTCPLIVQTLQRAVEAARSTLGTESFVVLTVGFDTRADTPERMRAYAQTRGIEPTSQWRFLSADAGTIDALARDLGFVFAASPKGFDHLAQTTIIDADGVVYRQVYGTDFDPPRLIEPLKDLLYGRRSEASSLSGLINRIRFICTIYDPAADRYRFSYAIFLGFAIGIASLGAVGFVLVRGWLRARHPSPQT